MSEPLIDPAVFAELADSVGEDFVRELVETFATEAATMRSDLRAALAQRDAERFRRAAHSLKSNAQTFGARRLAHAARALELGGLPSEAAALDALEADLAASLRALVERAGG
jgi:HPt (histidine-containing phosphotransfer) domain-containing protein